MVSYLTSGNLASKVGTSYTDADNSDNTHLFYYVFMILFFVFLAADRLDLNITSSLITMTQNTLKNWSEDYYGPTFMDGSQSKRDPGPQQDDAPSDSNLTVVTTAGHFRKRVPFVPFVLRNETGTIFFSFRARRKSSLIDELYLYPITLP